MGWRPRHDGSLFRRCHRHRSRCQGRYAQAGKVVYYQEPAKGSKYEDPIVNHYRYIITNLSDEAIYSPTYYDPKTPGMSMGRN